MIILDTDVLSALMRKHPDEEVGRWLSDQPATSIYTTTITEAEIRFGMALLPVSRRRRDLESALTAMIDEDLGGRVLPFDRAATRAYATIRSDRRRAGRPIAPFDAQIAAIACSRGAAVATRNVRDFEDCGVAVVDPWAADDGEA